MALQKRHIEHIQTWQASGLTQAVYCQQQGLNAKTFSRWFKTYQLSNQPTKPLLIPVEIKPATDTLPAPEPIWLRLTQGYALDVKTAGFRTVYFHENPVFIRLTAYFMV